jgi:hypothetical protein
MTLHLLRRASVAALALTVIGASAAVAATIDTDAVLGTSAAVPTAVSPGDNVFAIRVVATGNIAPDKTGLATITARYFMDAGGAITPSAQAADQQTLSFTTGFNYSQCPATDPPLGCPTNPFVVQATLVVPSGATPGTLGTLTVKNTGSSGLDADPTPDQGYVEVAGTLNRPPGLPGTPTLQAGDTPNKTGTFTVAWASATDPDAGDAVTYALQKRDADDPDWVTVEPALSSSSYAFTGEAEGTWRYRVRATDTHGATSDWAEDAAPIVKVDTSAPLAPTGSTDRDAEYVAGDGTRWWKDSVQVSFHGNGDPALSDGSAGSGVESTTGPLSVTAAGPFSAPGTSTDYAGNESASTTVSGSIDTAAPVVTPVCPSSVLLGQTGAAAAWTASDPSPGSGVASSSGTVGIDTSTVGQHTVTFPAGTAVDHVGHQSAETSCTYAVTYQFDGFLQPINDTAHYVGLTTSIFKAGSTVPAKLQLKDAQGHVVEAATAPQWITPVKGGPLPTTLAVDEATYSDTATAGGEYRWDATAQQYIYNWKTAKTQSGYFWRIGVILDDGTVHWVSIGLR